MMFQKTDVYSVKITKFQKSYDKKHKKDLKKILI